MPFVSRVEKEGGCGVRSMRRSRIERHVGGTIRCGGKGLGKSEVGKEARVFMEVSPRCTEERKRKFRTGSFLRRITAGEKRTVCPCDISAKGVKGRKRKKTEGFPVAKDFDRGNHKKKDLRTLGKFIRDKA